MFAAIIGPDRMLMPRLALTVSPFVSVDGNLGGLRLDCIEKIAEKTTSARFQLEGLN